MKNILLATLVGLGLTSSLSFAQSLTEKIEQETTKGAILVANKAEPAKTQKIIADLGVVLINAKRGARNADDKKIASSLKNLDLEIQNARKSKELDLYQSLISDLDKDLGEMEKAHASAIKTKDYSKLEALAQVKYDLIPESLKHESLK